MRYTRAHIVAARIDRLVDFYQEILIMKKINSRSMSARSGKGFAARTDGNAARALQTPTDLSPSNVHQVVAVLNPIVADSFALYMKTKNFHWHLSGAHFRDYHLLFDEQAATIFESIDILAERVRKIGGSTLKSISHVSKLQSIEDDDDDFVDAREMIQRLLQDNRTVAQNLRNAIHVCEDNDDSPTGNLLQEILDRTERRVWFLSEISTEAADS